jgi:hypothetical protein
MIALWALVVVSDDALSRVAVKEPVLVVVIASLYGRRDAPDHHLQNRAVVEVHPVALKQVGLHVGNYANSPSVVQLRKQDGRAPRFFLSRPSLGIFSGSGIKENLM